MNSTAHSIEGSTFDQIFRVLLFDLQNNPQHVCSPRGKKIKENLAVTLVLTDPRARLLSCKKRATNYGFGVGEFLWYWQGKQDLETMLYYNKRMKDFSDDGKTLNSAYGHRMRIVGYGPHWADHSQWEACVETLKMDPDSRRALLLINQPFDNVKAAMTETGSKDVPCTLSLQFFIRGGKLDLHTHMRSNDVMWGLTYDLFSFTLFQECMLLDLRRHEHLKDLQLGTYYHTAGSMHLYEHHFEQAGEIIREYHTPGMEMERPMEALESLEDLDEVADMEAFLREGEGNRVPTTGLKARSRTAHWMVRQLEDHRRKRDEEARKKSG